MSRHWASKEFLSADNFWSFIEEISTRLDIKKESSDNSELYKLFLAGREDMLDTIIGYLHENAVRLGMIVEENDILSPAELAEQLKGQ